MRRRSYDYTSVFRENVLPQLLYITRQDFSIEKQDRPMHSHDHLCELNIIYKGLGIYNVDDASYRVRTGDLIFHNCDESHELLSDKYYPVGAYCIGFTNVCFKEKKVNHLAEPDQSRVRSSGRDYLLLESLCEKLLDLDLNKPEEHALANVLGTSLLMTAVMIQQLRNPEVLSASTNEVTRRVKDYISGHFKEDITLNEIADALNYSTTYISHTFKKSTGYSPIEYVIRRRIGYAQTLLISSDLSVTHIATLAGYDNPNHFQTIFKKTTGISPLQFRKRYLNTLKGERDQT